MIIDSLVNEGFSRKFANIYCRHFDHDNQSTIYDPEFREWAHEKGFFVDDAYIYGLNEENYNQFISNYDYCRSYPFNSWSKIWVDDKITLKYFLGDSLSHTMPDYYFYVTPNGLRALSDNPLGIKQDAEALLEVLRLKGEIACKPNNGSLSTGFMKMSYENGVYCLNDKEASPHQVVDFVLSNPNLLLTEYLHPCEKYLKVNPLVPTIRLVVINTEGNNPRIACGYMRFATAMCGAANYTGAEDAFNYFVDVDVDLGNYGNGCCVYHNRVEESPRYPDNGILMEGAIPVWDEIVQMVDQTAKRLFNVEYMGYDITVARGNKPKIMEINSHPQIRIPQMYGSLFKKEWVRDYYKQKIK